MSKIHTQLYKQLLIESVRDSLPGKPTFPLPPLTIVELGQLMTLASQLACSTSAKSKTHSYEIATRVVEITKGSISGLNAAAELVLARIGNFPGQQLLRNRYVRNGESALKKHLYLALEAAARRAENTVNGADGNLVAFTDFQYDFYDALESTRSVSISAPTSAGKSYVLSLDIIRKIKNGTPTSVVYLVPTRALIRQVSLKIIKDLHTAGLRRIPVRCVPIPVDRSKFPQGAVYVLTQERLMSLLTPRDGEPWITSLIVDEAQGLRDGDRGIILHSAIDAVLDRFPKASVFFASPMAKNPEYLLELFDRSRASKHWVELHSPVSQNLILVTEAANSNRHVTFYINTRGPRITIGTHELGFVFQQARVFERRANFAKSVTRENESSIIYADRPSGTERIASELIKNEPEPDVVDPDIADLVNFLTVHIHPEYSLIKFLRYRIAFHYGAMPSIVRSRIEDLCSAGKLKFICCTSTLLQGINLPAKNIIMERPCKGTGEAMERGDFLNLSGRAGRMLKEFHGNVWCLRPDRWAKKSFEGEPLQEIESRFEETLSDHSNPIVNAAISEISGGTDSSGVVALGKVFSEFTQAGKSLVTSKYRTDQNENALREIEEKCAQIIVTLPAELFRRNAAISPVRIQDLYDYLKDQPELDSHMPLAPFDAFAYENMKNIFRVTREKLGRATDRRHLYYCLVAWRWMRGMPIGEMIRLLINHQRKNSRFVSADDSIRGLMKTIEEDVRHIYVKYLRAYEDVLAFLLTERGNIQAVGRLKPLHLFLDCGTADPLALALISIGLSRTTALILLRVRARIGLSKTTSAEACRAKFRGINWNSVDIPELCRAEIRDLIGI